ncbi:MAG: hypothetical protein QW625_01070 [Candidatus Nanoarchaeia archaeon]
MNPLWNAAKIKGSKLFLREKPIELLFCLSQGLSKEKYPSILAKDAKCTYSHTVHLLQKMERANIVKFEKKGRLKLVTLTKRGQELAELFDSLAKTFIK